MTEHAAPTSVRTDVPITADAVPVHVAQQDWTQPGAFEVADGVHRIPLPLPLDGLRAVNVYAVESDAGPVLVDGGWAIEVARDRLEKALAGIGHRLTHIVRFAVTHVHRDHYTQAVALRREFGTRVGLGIHERESLESTMRGVRPPASVEVLRRAGGTELVPELLASGFGSNTGARDWELPDEWFEGGDRIPITGSRHLAAVHTPGHTRGHMSFVDVEQRLVFSGDHVLPHITPSIGFEAHQTHLPLRDFLNSLRLMLELPDMAMLPAHGLPGPSIHKRVYELLAHHDQRLEQCRAEIGASASAYDVARKLRWTGRGRRFDELDPMNRMLAVNETAAHLDVLVARGALVREQDGDVRIYSA